jgi:hypothetical protein
MAPFVLIMMCITSGTTFGIAKNTYNSTTPYLDLFLITNYIAAYNSIEQK